MNTEKTAIAERIRLLRVQKRIKQIEITEKLGIKGQTLSTIESGGQYPTIPQLVALSDFFGVSLDYLVRN